MIISHKHRYLFVELPRTGSTAVSHELREHYDGERILYKHATYERFLRTASADERSYFVFSSIRNPMDSVVSRYFKLRTDHKQKFSRADDRSGEPGRLNRLLNRRMYGYIERSDADFATFFLRFYHVPFDTWASLSHDRFDYVMRFERLADDFDHVLRTIGIEPVRPLPLVNPTDRRGQDFSSYYTPPTHERARRVFGGYMARWGYAFPEDWELAPPSRLHQLEYRVVSGVAGLYWRHVRGRI